MKDPLKETTESKTQYRDHLENILKNPDLANVIEAHVCNGGTVISLAEIWDVKASDIFHWLFQDQDRTKLYNDWLNARVEWSKEIILQEIRKIGTVNLTGIFNDDHTLKPIGEWPEECVAALAGIEIQEVFEFRDGEKEKTGEIKKVKLTDKLKALELMGKENGMFSNKVELKGKLTLEQLVEASMSNPPNSGIKV